MKRILSLAVAAVMLSSATAQEAIVAPAPGDNWSIGIDGGVTTPLRMRTFLDDMRGAFGLHFQKQLTPVFALGVEGVAGVNTAGWHDYVVTNPLESRVVKASNHTMIDNSYVGIYGSFNLINMFGTYNPNRLIDVELTAGAGWGHEYLNNDALYPYDIDVKDQNYFMTKVGFNFVYNCSKLVAVSFKPYLAWNMTGTHYEALDVQNSTAAYKSSRATFNFLVGVNLKLGKQGFDRVQTRNQAEIDALNARINELQAQAAGIGSDIEAARAKAQGLADELKKCQDTPVPVQIIEKKTDNNTSVRYIYYRLGSSVITADQQPNVEMVAQYLKNHKNSKVVVKGYASKDGNEELNIKLAAARAEAVKAMLMNKYGIAADRIKAEGQGIGEMFSEEAWNRVAICLLED